jgi:hypothetical protein
MSIAWVCCSSMRSETIMKKTIRTLHRGGVKELLLVVPYEEEETYIQALQDTPIDLFIQGATKGLVNQRKHARAQFPVGQRIVFIDDDVTAIKILMWERTLNHCTQLDKLADQCFAHSDCLLWGVYPMCNSLFMKHLYRTGNCYIVGAFYGIINDPRLQEPEIDELEDYERQLSEQKANRPPVRFDWIGIETRYFKNKGGMQQDRTVAKRQSAVLNIEERYPELVKTFHRKDGTADLRFLQKPEIQEQSTAIGSWMAEPTSSISQSIHAISHAEFLSLPSPDDPQPESIDHIHHVSEDHPPEADSLLDSEVEIL